MADPTQTPGVDPDIAALQAAAAAQQAPASGPPQSMVDDQGVPRVVPPEDVASAHAQGWRDVSDIEAHELAVKQAAQAEAGEHPVEAGALSAFGSLVPGGRRVVSGLGGPSLPDQAVLEQENPTASFIGSLAGTGAQIAAVTLATGGIGDLAEGASLAAKGVEGAEAAAKIAKATDLAASLGLDVGTVGRLARFGQAAVQGATQGVTGGMTEADLGNVGYNSAALVQDAGLGALLGLGGESALQVGEKVVPPVITAAKKALGSLEDKGVQFLGWGSAKFARNPEVAEQIGKAATEIFEGEGAPTTKAAKLIKESQLNKAAVDLRDSLTDSLDKVADTEQQLFSRSRPDELENLGAMHDIGGGAAAAKGAVNDLITNQLEPAIATNALGKWNTPIEAATNGLNALKEGVQQATTSAAVHEALTEFRRSIDPYMKYGRAIGANADERITADLMNQKILGPTKDLLGRYTNEAEGAARTLTPESVAAFGSAQAERNALVNESFNQMRTDRDNLMTALGYTSLSDAGRPTRKLDAGKILSLIKGEGEEGEIGSARLDKFKTALNNYLGSASQFADTAAESAKSAVQEQVEPGALKEMLSDVADKRAAAQKILLPTEVQQLAEMTSKTGEGAGGLRGATRNAPGDVIGTGAMISGHPIIGAAITAANRIYSGIKYPVETLYAYDSIRRAAAKSAGLVSAAVQAFLGSSTRGAAAGLLGKAAPSVIDDQERFRTLSAQLQNLASNPVAAANQLGQKTTLLQAAPMHMTGVAGVAMTGQQILSQAIPKNPNPSPLGPGHDHWKPSQSELHKFDQIQQAVLYPHTVFQNLTRGTLTPDAWMAYAKTYPEQANDLKSQALLYLARNNDQELTVAQKMGLSMVVGAPITNDMKPDQIALQQAVWAQTAPPPHEASARGSKGRPRAKGLDKLNFSTETGTAQQQHEERANT